MYWRLGKKRSELELILSGVNLGLSPSSTLDLLDEYPDEEVQWFFEKLQKQVQAQKLADEIGLANVILIALNGQNKKGFTAYNKWRRDHIDAIDELTRERTVFEKLKAQKRVVTVFDQLKASKE